MVLHRSASYIINETLSVVYLSSLIPRANAWLQEHTETHLIKCETVEKKVSTVDEVDCDGNMFLAKGNCAIYIKGLRLVGPMYIYIVLNSHFTSIVISNCHTRLLLFRLCYFRLWYVNIRSHVKDSSENVAPSEIGYMNVIPKCIDSTGMSSKFDSFLSNLDNYHYMYNSISGTPDFT